MNDAHQTQAQLLTELAALRQQIKALQTSAPRRTEMAEPLASTPRVVQSALDALAVRLAILDAHGTILAVNAAWRQFANANAFEGTSYGVGVNYLALCEAATGGSRKKRPPWRPASVRSWPDRKTRSPWSTLAIVMRSGAGFWRG